MSVLSLDHVTYSYPGAAAPSLVDVSLDVAPGELLVVAGGSGSGKSTLLRTANGLAPHFHGGVFSGNAWENLAGSGLEQIVVTDTIPLPPGAPDNVRVLSCADLLTSSIRQIFTDGSVSGVFGGENQLF